MGSKLALVFRVPQFSTFCLRFSPLFLRLPPLYLRFPSVFRGLWIKEAGTSTALCVCAFLMKLSQQRQQKQVHGIKVTYSFENASLGREETPGRIINQWPWHFLTTTKESCGGQQQKNKNKNKKLKLRNKKKERKRKKRHARQKQHKIDDMSHRSSSMLARYKKRPRKRGQLTSVNIKPSRLMAQSWANSWQGKKIRFIIY